MFCPRCGAETDESARYCAGCGATLADAERTERAGQPKRSFGGRLATLVGRTRRQRLLSASTVAAIAIGIAAFFALETGPDEDGGSGRLAVADVGAADAACVEAKRTIRGSAARALRSGDGDLETYSADFLRATVEFRSIIRSLGSDPATGQLDRALREVTIEAGALSRTARENPGVTGDRVVALDAATAEAEAAITELGLAECSTVELDPRSLLVQR